MKSENKIYYFYLIIIMVGFVLKPCHVFAQVKYYNSALNQQEYKSNNTLTFYNFNKKLIKTNTFYLSTLDYKLYIELSRYSQFCDSSGFPILTRQYFSFYDKQANKIPLFFSPQENEIRFSGFFTNKSKYVFAILGKYYRPQPEIAHPGSINIIRFTKNANLLDTIIIKDDMFNWNQIFIGYSPNCDFNYILTEKRKNKGIEMRVYKTDSIFHRTPKVVYSSNYTDIINSISTKGDVIAINDRNQTDKRKKQYALFYLFNSQKLIINQSQPFFGLQTENNSLGFSADGQFLFHISHDSLLQYSFRYLQSDSILKYKKLIGMVEKAKSGENQFSQFCLFPDENLYFTTNFGVAYVIIKDNDTQYTVSKTNIIPSYGDHGIPYSNTALYHPHFRIESKDTVCVNETVTFKTNHIDSFASYHWIIKDSKNTVLLNSYSISHDFKPTVPGIYNIQLIYRWRCNSMDSTSKFLIVKDYPTIVKIKDSTICYNGSFTSKINSNFKHVIWSNNTQGNRFETTNRGIYSVIYTDGCMNYKDTFEVNVIEELKPQLTRSQIVMCNPLESYVTTLQLPKASYYNWMDGYGSLNRTISKPGNFQIKFYNQCQTLDEPFEVFYSEKKPELYIPNAITPNGDQLNENWEINDPSNIKEIEWMIFNRWGEKIDQGKAAHFDLKRLINRNNHNQGIYYYQFIITFQCNSIRKTYNGLFHLFD